MTRQRPPSKSVFLPLTDHEVECAPSVRVSARQVDHNDVPTEYEILHDPVIDGDQRREFVLIPFQHGTVPKHGLNGVTNESLLAIVLRRLRGFQRSPFACRENHVAIAKIEDALLWLHHRTRDRQARGVEGEHQP